MTLAYDTIVNISIPHRSAWPRKLDQLMNQSQAAEPPD
jgi:hypothetical protein